MNGRYGLTNELVADRHREWLHEAEQRRRTCQVAAPCDRWTRGFVTRVRTAPSRVTPHHDAPAVAGLPTGLMGL
jgi:hypothetical protein